MAKRPTISTIGSGFYGTTQLNNNFSAINTAFDNTLSRDGSSPNSMGADIDMNNNDILNVSTLQATGITLNGVGITPTSVAATPAAASITITDAGGYYTATDVEGALQEIQTDVAAAYQPLDAQLTALAATSITGVSGSDTSLITGTAGTAGNVATWNADGDLVDGGYAPGAMVFLEQVTPSAVSDINLTAFDNTKYSAYKIITNSLRPTGTNNQWGFKFSNDGGSTWLSSAGAYTYAYNTITNTPSTGTGGSTGDTTIIIGSSGPSDSVFLQALLYVPLSGGAAAIDFEYSAPTFRAYGHGRTAAAYAVNAVQLTMLSGSWTSGDVRLYGIRKA